MQCSIDFDPPHNGTATSIAAAKAVMPRAGTIRERIYQLIARQKLRGMTADEVEFGMAMSGDTVRPRLIELRREGRIYKSDTTRPTRKGQQAVVYMVHP